MAVSEDQDELFAELALEKGWLAADQAREARRILQRLEEVGLRRRLWQVCVDRGFLAPARVEILKRALVRERGVPVRLAGYEILERLGQGGMGQVFRARQEGADREVAVKVLNAELAKDSAFARRFEREARLAMRLDHPNLVRALGCGRDGTRRYFVMELVEGHAAGEAVEREGPFPPERVAEIGIQAARGLAHAHASGIVHRDVKPSNLLLALDGTVKVADLGLAVEGPAKGSGARPAAWTPAYAAPEQLRENACDARSDVYSLGAALFHLLTGTPPYAGASAYEVMAQHVGTPAPSARERRPEVPASLDAVLRKMMAKQPADRYASMEAVEEDLSAVLGGQTPLALRFSPEAEGRRLEARRRAALLVAATGSLIFGLGLIAHQARQRAAAAAAVPVVLFGEVWDASAERPLVGARVVCTRSGREAATDAYGAFRIASPPGPSHKLRLLAEGRAPAVVSVESRSGAVWVGALALGTDAPPSRVRRADFRLGRGEGVVLSPGLRGLGLEKSRAEALGGDGGEMAVAFSLSALDKDRAAVSLESPGGLAYAGRTPLDHGREAPPAGYRSRLEWMEEGDAFFFRVDGGLYGKARLVRLAEGEALFHCVLQASGGRLFPPGPAELTSAWEDGTVLLRWGEVPEASSHDVWRREPFGRWVRLGRTRSSAFRDRSVRKGALYLYAVDSRGEEVGTTDAAEIRAYAGPPGMLFFDAVVEDQPVHVDLARALVVPADGDAEIWPHGAGRLLLRPHARAGVLRVAGAASSLTAAPLNGYSSSETMLHAGEVCFLRTPEGRYAKAEIVEALSQRTVLTFAVRPDGGRVFPPGPPGLRAEKKDGEIWLSWERPPEGREVRYRLWVRPKGQAWRVAGETRETRWRLPAKKAGDAAEFGATALCAHAGQTNRSAVPAPEIEAGRK